MITLTREEAQQVLDAFEVATTHFAKDRQEILAARENLRARLAQPEPEPVAKMREMLEVQGRDGTWNYEPYFHGMYNGMELMLALAESRDPVFRKAPEKWLNTPPQRNWQGLTNKEYEAMAEKYVTNCYFDTLKYARAIEAKLKEKNT